MKTKVTFPLSLSKLTGNKTELECQAETLGQLLENLNRQYPGIKKIKWPVKAILSKAHINLQHLPMPIQPARK